MSYEHILNKIEDINCKLIDYEEQYNNLFEKTLVNYY